MKKIKNIVSLQKLGILIKKLYYVHWFVTMLTARHFEILYNFIAFSFRAQMPSVMYRRLDGSTPAGSRQDIVHRYVASYLMLGAHERTLLTATRQRAVDQSNCAQRKTREQFPSFCKSVKS